MATTIRPADPSEDPSLAMILCNAFLPIWNHNWFQNVSEPLSPVPIKAGKDISDPTITSIQRARVGFYLSLIKATRLLGGEIHVNIVNNNTTTTSQAESSNQTSYGAILLWLPPHKRLGITKLPTLYSSGFLGTMFRYGLVGIYRVNFVFEANIEKMFRAAGVNPDERALIQMLASNPEYRGRGLASELLKWRIDEFEKESPGTDVVLDTSTQQGIRTYERMGFKLLGEVDVDTGCDAVGVRLAKGRPKDGDVKHTQWVMIRQT